MYVIVIVLYVEAPYVKTMYQPTHARAIFRYKLMCKICSTKTIPVDGHSVDDAAYLGREVIDFRKTKKKPFYVSFRK